MAKKKNGKLVLTHAEQALSKIMGELVELPARGPREHVPDRKWPMTGGIYVSLETMMASKHECAEIVTHPAPYDGTRAVYFHYTRLLAISERLHPTKRGVMIEQFLRLARFERAYGKKPCPLCERQVGDSYYTHFIDHLRAMGIEIRFDKDNVWRHRDEIARRDRERRKDDDEGEQWQTA